MWIHVFNVGDFDNGPRGMRFKWGRRNMGATPFQMAQQNMIQPLKRCLPSDVTCQEGISHRNIGLRKEVVNEWFPRKIQIYQFRTTRLSLWSEKFNVIILLTLKWFIVIVAAVCLMSWLTSFSWKGNLSQRPLQLLEVTLAASAAQVGIVNAKTFICMVCWEPTLENYQRCGRLHPKRFLPTHRSSTQL